MLADWQHFASTLEVFSPSAARRWKKYSKGVRFVIPLQTNHKSKQNQTQIN